MTENTYTVGESDKTGDVPDALKQIMRDNSHSLEEHLEPPATHANVRRTTPESTMANKPSTQNPPPKPTPSQQPKPGSGTTTGKRSR